MASNENEFTLGQLIKNTANELRDARAQTASDAVMQFEKCELELAVSTKADAKGGFKFHFIEAGVSVSGETVSKIKLSFGPIAGNTGVFQASPDGSKGVPHSKD